MHYLYIAYVPQNGENESEMLVLRPPRLDYFPALFSSFSVVSSSRGIKGRLE